VKLLLLPRRQGEVVVPRRKLLKLLQLRPLQRKHLLLKRLLKKQHLLNKKMLINYLFKRQDYCSCLF
jgi:hypothetical protein